MSACFHALGFTSCAWFWPDFTPIISKTVENIVQGFHNVWFLFSKQTFGNSQTILLVLSRKRWWENTRKTYWQENTPTSQSVNFLFMLSTRDALSLFCYYPSSTKKRTEQIEFLSGTRNCSIINKTRYESIYKKIVVESLIGITNCNKYCWLDYLRRAEDKRLSK